MRRRSLTLLLLLSAALQGCASSSTRPVALFNNPSPPKETKAEELLVAEDKKTMEFCRTVPDVITPEDKTCGRFFDRIKAEQKQELAAAEAAQKKAREAALEDQRNSAAPGVQGRSADKVCQSTSPACQRWTELARKCEANMRAIEAGDLTPKQPYCMEMENLRESATGIELSSDPGAYDF